MSALEYDGIRVLITGGAGGIGAATALVLMARGARVAVVDVNIEGAPAGALAVTCDLTDADQVQATVDSIAEQFGGLDVVINNAGIGAVGDVAANSDEEWLRVLDVNVVSMARVTRAALPYLRLSKHAAVVNTCSAVAYVGVRQRVLYSASKGAVEGLTLAMAADHVREGIRVNAVAPGTADTPWVGRLLDQAEDPVETRRALEARQPLGRLVTADEVAHAIAHLASPLSASTTGIVLRVDAGMTTLRI